LGFFLGAKSFFFGIQALFHNPKLRNTAILPLLISFLIFVLVTYFVCFVYLPTLVAGLLVSAGTGFWAWVLTAGAQSLAFLLGLVASGLITFILATWIASPFNSLLAEKALVYFESKPEVPFDTKKWLKTTLKMASISMIRSAILLVFGFVLFLLSFVPFLHLPLLFIGFFIISTDCLDYSLEILEFDLRARFRYYSQHFVQISGFSTALGLTFLIPGLSFLLMPAAIVGAAHMASQIKLQMKARE